MGSDPNTNPVLLLALHSTGIKSGDSVGFLRAASSSYRGLWAE
jgi:hypothetical protein